MIDVKQNWLRILAFVILLGGCLVLMIIQVNAGNKVTTLEASLLNLIQFCLSIGFSWLLSKVVFESSYKESQKKLAVAAFRRIKEIERNVQRTQSYVNSGKNDPNSAVKCLEVIDFSLTNTKDTIRSSISDWEDIIGEELDIADKIEELVSEQSDASFDSSNNTDNHQRFDEIEKEIVDLKSKLPVTMRRTILAVDNEARKAEAVAVLGKVILEQNGLDLYGFWEERGKFMIDLSQISVGDKVHVALGLAGNRYGTLMAYDSGNKTFGVITNRCGGPYHDFTHAMEVVFGRKLMPFAYDGIPLVAEVIEISPLNLRNGRQHFKLKVKSKLCDEVIYKYPELECLHNKLTQK
ncbi:hypothetical protein [Aliivibrio fischeri]|uniref:hypothetical protein n=1 Tax=Aliivibrio fischeri TaxID=668 RepID=UPI00080EAFAB|nr:hypothetical protein [Aliivibrio fischeri]OCH40475.1 hypothetical protein A6D99_19030 [Aliivibrio fischeri]